MPHKSFQLAADQIKPVATGYGSCFATDRITVDGAEVGYCYREEPNVTDSGWRFFAGDESDAYTSDPDNFALYDVNTIANYDPSITVLLEAAPGSVFERDESGHFIPVVSREA